MRAPSTGARRLALLGLAFGLLLAGLFLPTERTSGQGTAPFGFAWGSDNHSQVGNGPPLIDERGALLVADPSGGCCLGSLVDIQGGHTHALALDAAGNLFAWGDNTTGQVGNGTWGAAALVPLMVSGPTGAQPGSPQQETIAAEGDHSLVADPSGRVWSWGNNDHGQLGYGTTGQCGVPPSNRPCGTSPAQVTGLPPAATGVGAGERHSLAIIGDCTSGPAEAYAWGDNGSGQLGDATTNGHTPPAPVHGPLNAGTLTGVARVAGGQGHSLALMCNGEVMAWGANTSGQLGNGTTTFNPVPSLVVTACPPNTPPPKPLLGCPLGNVVDIAAGYGHSIAVDANGDTWFWGGNQFGQLCDGTTANQLFATKSSTLGSALTAVSPGRPLNSVAGGANFSLVLLANHRIAACGGNMRGELGSCQAAAALLPVTVVAGPCPSVLPLSGVLMVESGESFSLAIASYDTVAPRTSIIRRAALPSLARD